MNTPFITFVLRQKTCSRMIIVHDFKTCRLNEILPQLIKAKCSLLGPFLCGSLLSHLSRVSAEYVVSGFIRYKPGAKPVLGLVCTGSISILKVFASTDGNFFARNINA